jgi:PAS domain S-box-containing protein
MANKILIIDDEPDNTEPFQSEEVVTLLNKHLRLERVQEELKAKNALLECEIAKRVRAEAAFKESEANLRQFMENARGFGVYSVEIDDEQPYGTRTVFASPSIKDILNVENPEDNAGWFEHIHADDLDRVTAAHHTSRTTGQEFDEIFRNYHAGKQEWTWIRAISAPVMASDGTFTHFNGLIVDVTDIKQAAETLRENEEKYSSLFHNNHSVMLLIDAETGNIVDANPSACAFYGYKKEVLIKKQIKELNTLSEKEISQEMKRAKSEQRELFNFRHRLANGDIRDVEVFSGPVFVRKKRFLYSIIHDVTERRYAEEELKRKNKDLDIFNRLTVNRELKMVELKKEINCLAKEAGQEPRYVIAE